MSSDQTPEVARAMTTRISRGHLSLTTLDKLTPPRSVCLSVYPSVCLARLYISCGTLFYVCRVFTQLDSADTDSSETDETSKCVCLCSVYLCVYLCV